MSSIYKYIIRIYERFPYIPDFGRPDVIMRIIIGMFYICVIYSFIGVDNLSSVAGKLYEIIKWITPYLMVEILTLILISNKIKKIKPLYQIITLSLITLLNVYTITSVATNSLWEFFSNKDRAISVSIVSLGVLFFFLIYFDWSERNNNPDVIKAKLISLQSKMRPHFLFNTLNSIVSLIKSEPNIAKEMVLNLSELLRASLKENDESSWSIAEELEICSKYLSIEKIRLGDRLSIKFDIDDNAKKYVIPKISIQPIIENAILHGIQKIDGGGEILVNITVDENINIQVLNSVSIGEAKTNNGYSIKNLQNRLNMFYKGKYNLQNMISGKYYEVRLQIPKAR